VLLKHSCSTSIDFNGGYILGKPKIGGYRYDPQKSRSRLHRNFLTDKDMALHVMDDLNSQAIPYMEPLTKDADPRVRRAAVNAVNRITKRQSRSSHRQN
jgi:hypothetical protein